MKFEKDVAHVKLYFYDGNTCNETHEEFKLNPSSLANRLMSHIDKGNQLHFVNGFYEGEFVESFEIVNFDELHERYLERLEEGNDDDNF